jgi:hypothetical protein
MTDSLDDSHIGVSAHPNLPSGSPLDSFPATEQKENIHISGA